MRENLIPCVIVIIQFAALHPVWRWQVARLTDGSDEPWGLVALCTVAAFLWHAKRENDSFTPSLILPSILMVLYAVTFPFVPRLIQGWIGLTALACTVSSLRMGRAFHLGALGLFWLSLPIISSLQFYLGYPMRVLSGTLAAGLLQLGGMAVLSEGACLRWGEQLISIDAGCSGIRMLWAGLFLAFTLACLYRLSYVWTLGLAVCSVVAIILANAVRSAALFYLEGGIVSAPRWGHDATGIVVFAATALAIAYLGRLLGAESGYQTRQGFVSWNLVPAPQQSRESEV